MKGLLRALKGHPKLMTMIGSLCRCIVALCIVRNGTGCRTAAVGTPLLLTSGPTRCEEVLHGCGTSLVCLFYAIATVFQLYHGGDMYEMRRRKTIVLNLSGWPNE